MEDPEINQTTTRLKGIIKQFSGKVSLDAGCGEGQYAKYFRARTIGLDIVARMRNKMQYDEFVLGSIYHLPFKEKTFDFILLSEVIEHLPAATSRIALEELKRTGKTVVLTTPNRNLLFSILSRFFYGRERQDHLSRWSVKTLKKHEFAVHGCLGWVTAQKIPLKIQRIWNFLAWKMPSLFGGDLIGIYEEKN